MFKKTIPVILGILCLGTTAESATQIKITCPMDPDVNYNTIDDIVWTLTPSFVYSGKTVLISTAKDTIFICYYDGGRSLETKIAAPATCSYSKSAKTSLAQGRGDSGRTLTCIGTDCDFIYCGG